MDRICRGARVAIVSSAGLVRRGEEPFRGRDPDYRVIPADTKPRELLISHISINFDRTGFQEDWNVVFPIDRLNELANERMIGSVAGSHYSFMGATDPLELEPYAREVAGHLKADAVEAVRDTVHEAESAGERREHLRIVDDEQARGHVSPLGNPTVPLVG